MHTCNHLLVLHADHQPSPPSLPAPHPLGLYEGSLRAATAVAEAYVSSCTAKHSTSQLGTRRGAFSYLCISCPNCRPRLHHTLAPCTKQPPRAPAAAVPKVVLSGTAKQCPSIAKQTLTHPHRNIHTCNHLLVHADASVILPSLAAPHPAVGLLTTQHPQGTTRSSRS